MRTKEQIKTAIEQDNFSWLGRESFIEDFANYLIKENDSKHICLDGAWGSGKTTTLFGIINKIKEITQANEEYPPLILYLDAWEYENYEHPTFALLKVMEDSDVDIKSELEEAGKVFFSSFNSSLSLKILGFSADFNLEEHPDSKILKQGELVDSLNNIMIKAINKYKEEKNNKLIIIIDELDRAKPDFAMKILETFHHLRDDLLTHVVYSVDRNQLNSIIKHYYGYEYNTNIFIDKIFDLTFKLEKISNNVLSDYILKKLISDKIKMDLNSIRNCIYKYLAILEHQSLRTINMLCEKIIHNLSRGFFKSYSINNNNLYYFPRRQKVLWEYLDLYVLLQVLYFKDPISVIHWTNGENLETLLDIIREYNPKFEESNIGFLIEVIFNYSKDASEKKDIIDISDEEIITCLKYILKPNIEEKPYTDRNKCVFEDIDF